MFDKSSIEYFNYYLREFLNTLISTYPDSKQPIVNTYREVLEGRNDSNSLYVKSFIKNIEQYSQFINNKDENVFMKNVFLLEAVNFKSIWLSRFTTDENRGMIWKYLQMLMILAKSAVPSVNQIENMIRTLSENNRTYQSNIDIGPQMPAGHISQTGDKDEDEEDKSSGSGILGAIGNMMGGGSSGGANPLGALGAIGSMMGGGSSGGGANPLGALGALGSMMGGLGGDQGINSETAEQMVGAIGQMAQSLAENLQNIIPQPSSQSNNPPTNQTDNQSNSADVEVVEGQGISIDTSSDEPTNENTENSTENSTQDSNPKSGLDGVFSEDGIFGELAQEMSETFDFDDKDINENDNVGDVFKKFMSGDNPTKFMNMVQKFGSKIQNEISSGKIDQNKLMKETFQMMGNLQNPQAMAQQAQQAQQSQQAQQAQQAYQAQQMGQNMGFSNRRMKRAANRLANSKGGANRLSNMSRKDRMRSRLQKKMRAKQARDEAQRASNQQAQQNQSTQQSQRPPEK